MSDTPKPRTFVRMFKPEFAPLIRSDEKLQTIRPVPKIMPRRGDFIDPRMWEGKPYHSKQVKILEEPRIILVVEPIKLCHMHYFDGSDVARFNMETLAKLDGFKSWNNMRQWFEREYKINLERTPFSGVVILWARKEQMNCDKYMYNALHFCSGLKGVGSEAFAELVYGRNMLPSLGVSGARHGIEGISPEAIEQLARTYGRKEQP